MKTLLCGLMLLSGAVMAEKHSHDFAMDVNAFHDILSPLWHAEANEKRQRQTCAQLPSLQQMAEKMRYPSAAKLAQSISDLQKFCSADVKTFNASFAQVHDVFHLVAEEKLK